MTNPPTTRHSTAGERPSLAPHSLRYVVPSSSDDADQTTATREVDATGVREGVGTAPALVIVGSAAEPDRLGEIAFLPTTRDGGYTLGRQGTVTWLRHRPGETRETESSSDRFLSRQQVVFSAENGHPVAENTGRLPLFLNGRPVKRTPLRTGDLLEIGDRMMLLVTERPDVLGGEVESRHRFGRPDATGWVGEGAAAWEARETLRFLARRNAHCLILGESGTGKELMARGLHAHSSRSGQAMVSRNAATIPESLADAELFGNLAGYPNAGMPARPGLIGEAHRSTLFLDEFGELPSEVQARLLRVLDSGEYTRLGEARARNADLRLIAATNRDPSTLKHDVLARLQLRVQLPGLNERTEDVPLLAAHLLRRIASEDPELADRFFPDGDPDGHPRISLRLLRQLLVHRYTTHVRELEALLWRSITAARGDTLEALTAEDQAAAQKLPRVVEGPRNPADLDPDVIQAALDRHGGRQEPVWKELGLASRHVLARLVKKHGLKVRGR